MSEPTAAKQIDAIIAKHAGWKGDLISDLRALILQTHPGIIEEVKWKMKNRPEGLPVWSHNGIICFAEIWKDNVKLLFPKGARITDSGHVFNARLQSKDIRVIEFKEGSTISKSAIQDLIRTAIRTNH